MTRKQKRITQVILVEELDKKTAIILCLFWFFFICFLWWKGKKKEFQPATYSFWTRKIIQTMKFLKGRRKDWGTRKPYCGRHTVCTDTWNIGGSRSHVYGSSEENPHTYEGLYTSQVAWAGSLVCEWRLTRRPWLPTHIKGYIAHLQPHLFRILLTVTLFLSTPNMLIGKL